MVRALAEEAGHDLPEEALTMLEVGSLNDRGETTDSQGRPTKGLLEGSSRGVFSRGRLEGEGREGRRRGAGGGGRRRGIPTTIR